MHPSMNPSNSRKFLTYDSSLQDFSQNHRNFMLDPTDTSKRSQTLNLGHKNKKVPHKKLNSPLEFAKTGFKTLKHAVISKTKKLGSPDKRSSSTSNHRLPPSTKPSSNLSSCFPTVFGNPEYINFYRAANQVNDENKASFCPPPPLPIRDDARYMSNAGGSIYGESVLTRPTSSAVLDDEDVLQTNAESGMQMQVPPPNENSFVPLQPPAEFNDKSRSHSAASARSHAGSYVRRKHDSQVGKQAATNAYNKQRAMSERQWGHKPHCNMGYGGVYGETKSKHSCRNNHIYALPAQLEGNSAAICSTTSLPQLSYEREYGGVSQCSNGTPLHDLVDDEESLYNGMHSMMSSARRKHYHHHHSTDKDLARHNYRGKRDYLKLQRRSADDTNPVLAVYCRTSEPRKEQELFIQYPIKETSLFSNNDGSRRGHSNTKLQSLLFNQV